MTFEVSVRKKRIVNTDPLRRCYNGCNFSEEEVWSDWQPVASYPDRAVAEESVATFKAINQDREYRILS